MTGTQRGGAIWVLVISLIASAAVLLRASVDFIGLLGTGFPIFLLVLFVVFGVLFLVFAYGTWRRNRWAYVGGIVASAIFLILESSDLGRILSNPGDPNFTDVLLFIVAAPMSIIYGAYNFYAAKRPQMMPKQISRASVLGLIALGFVLGGVIVGAAAASTQTRLLANASSGKDVNMAIGSSNPNNNQFYIPSTLTVSTGKTVVWFNGDTAAHTVTSTTNAFDSGDMASGATYQFTFNTAGSYDYYCTYHPFMKGAIVVQG